MNWIINYKSPERRTSPKDSSLLFLYVFPTTIYGKLLPLAIIRDPFDALLG